MDIKQIFDKVMGKKKIGNEIPVEEMENPLENPDRPLKAGEVHKIGKPKTKAFTKGVGGE